MSKRKKKKYKNKKKRRIKRKKKKIHKRKIKKTSSRKKDSKETRDSDGNIVFKVPSSWERKSYVNKNQYAKKYKISIQDNENFWRKEGKRINWIK